MEGRWKREGGGKRHTSLFKDVCFTIYSIMKNKKPHRVRISNRGEGAVSSANRNTPLYSKR
ncbi:MAG: hypothetical protein QXP36_11480 [Conexivisphaerales archaeon]